MPTFYNFYDKKIAKQMPKPDKSIEHLYKEDSMQFMTNFFHGYSDKSTIEVCEPEEGKYKETKETLVCKEMAIILVQ